jgi:hypothetical protein
MNKSTRNPPSLVRTAMTVTAPTTFDNKQRPGIRDSDRTNGEDAVDRNDSSDNHISGIAVGVSRGSGSS